MAIRAARADEADEIAALYLRARNSAFPAIPRSVHPDGDASRWVAEQLMPDLWVAIEGGSIVAMMALASGWLEQLYVDPVAQGQGVGGALVEVAKDEQPAGLELWCFEANERARRFYEWHNFALVERTDGSRNEERTPDVRYQWTP